MIMNPVIQGGGAEEKEYKITNNTQIKFPTSAMSGHPVFGTGNATSEIRIDALKFPDIPIGLPYNEGSYPIPSGVSARVPQSVYLFVMPASDVTIKQL